MCLRTNSKVIQSPHSALGEETICASLLPDYHLVSAASAITEVGEKWEAEQCCEGRAVCLAGGAGEL